MEEGDADDKAWEENARKRLRIDDDIELPPQMLTYVIGNPFTMSAPQPETMALEPKRPAKDGGASDGASIVSSSTGVTSGSGSTAGGGDDDQEGVGYSKLTLVKARTHARSKTKNLKNKLRTLKTCAVIKVAELVKKMGEKHSYVLESGWVALSKVHADAYAACQTKADNAKILVE